MGKYRENAQSKAKNQLENTMENTIMNNVNAAELNMDSLNGIAERGAKSFEAMTKACWKMSFPKLCEAVRRNGEMYIAALTVAMDKSINDYIANRRTDYVNGILRAMSGLKEQGAFGREFIARVNAVDTTMGKDEKTVELLVRKDAVCEYKNGAIVRTDAWYDLSAEAQTEHYKTAERMQQMLQRNRFGYLKSHRDDTVYEEQLRKQLKSMLARFNKQVKAGNCLESTKAMMVKVEEVVAAAGFIELKDL